MPTKPPRRKRCNHCNVWVSIKGKTCPFCQGALIINRWRMTRGRIARAHILAEQKGLTDEEYHWRLEAVGVDSCKHLKKDQYYQFIAGLNKLPDAPGR